MESAAWSTFAAVILVHQAAMIGEAFDQDSLVSFLSNSESIRPDELGKGSSVSFREWNHQLRQPIYMVEGRPDTGWGTRLSQRLAVAQVVGVVPGGHGTVQSVEVLDRLGVGPGAGQCD